MFFAHHSHNPAQPWSHNKPCPAPGRKQMQITTMKQYEDR